MNIQRNLFNTLMGLCLTLLLIGVTANASLADNKQLYTVNNIRTDVTADSAVDARFQALEEARKKGFTTLAKRILKEDAAEKLEDIDDLTISSMIKTLEIENEQLSNIRYVATISIVFDQKAIESYFYSTGDSFTTSVRQPIMILPWFVTAGQARLWQDNNPWRATWASMAQSSGTVVPLKLPLGDIMDIRDYAPTSLFGYQGDGLGRLRQRYGVDDIFLAVAEPLGNEIAVSIYDTETDIPNQIQSFKINASESSSPYRQAVERTLSILQSDWKNKTSISSQAPAQSYQMIARFSGLQGWISMRESLNDITMIEHIDILSVSPQKANINITYRGDIQTLATILDQYGIAMIQTPVQAISPASTNAQPQNQFERNSYNRMIREPSRNRMVETMQYELFMKNNRF